MSDSMRSWRSTASAGLSALRTLAQQNISRTPSQQQVQGTESNAQRQTWKQWAGQKLRGQPGDNFRPDLERISLFPGWAVRRYAKPDSDAFEVDVYVSGFASVHSAPDFASRSQRAFIRLAKGFASLPKLAEGNGALRPSKSTEQILQSIKLPARPEDMTEETEMEALEREFQRANEEELEPQTPTTPTTPSTRSSSPELFEDDSILQKLHDNLESRLRPFWSSVLPSRPVRVRLYAAPDGSPDGTATKSEHGPVASANVTTSADGSFEALFRLPWEHLCQHPEALHIAFGQPQQEHNFAVVADLMPPRPTLQQQSPYGEVQESPPMDAQRLKTPTCSTDTRIRLTHSRLRVISDIDDTVKRANVTDGARAVFHTVFVKELSEIVIPGMGEWYETMFNRGVRFHYVSNGPFEMLPILEEFFRLSKLPPGSVKLKSYAGRSLFTGLLSAPATRKRAGVQDILDVFPESKFILIGDSGEQDIELYAEFARERPSQILGVFIRDVNTGEPLDDPTGTSTTSIPFGAGLLDTSLEPPSLPPRPPTALVRDPTARPGRRAVPATGTGKMSRKAVSEDHGYLVPNLVAEPETIDEDDTKAGGSISEQWPPTEQRSGGMEQPTRTPPINMPRRNTSSSVMSSSAPSGRSYRIRSRTPSVASTASSTMQGPKMSEPERRRYELQLRVYRARDMIPEHIPFRVFRSPEECVEAEGLLKKIGV
ncbi:hypothetical protein BD626DRAFT_454209 [Schizophyllum amplum]|uniref:Phosphatidate phosphatase APP1 catalytic domain-containing protein n=1 Tax=Schizophyllum amplum TaxID=97359 RepID=A0A550CKU9_9AGAR|nr:hypothetical protein BD626DRAFT_454209 [Auriculariopsis ampla]